MPSDEYREALSNATAFKQENPEEKTTAAARIYQVNDSSVRTALLREQERQTKPATSHGDIIRFYQMYKFLLYISMWRTRTLVDMAQQRLWFLLQLAV
jgi:ABC-type nitrate/sulfonate/bicarbonate transport system substrate-binding protein